jgi:hypothetical protein
MFSASVESCNKLKKKIVIAFQVFSESGIVEYSVKEKAILSAGKQEVQNLFCNHSS